MSTFRTGDHTALHSVDKHPGQSHIVATGGEDGMLCIWDLRQEKFPVTLLEAHSAASRWSFTAHRLDDHAQQVGGRAQRSK